MGYQADKKFTWVIKKYSSYSSYSISCDKVYSDIFVAGRCKWRLVAYPKGTPNCGYDNPMSLYLSVPYSESLPSGWTRQAKVSFTMVNQIPGELSQLRESEYRFDQKNTICGFEKMFRPSDLRGSSQGFLVNDEIKIVAEVHVLEVIGKLDVPAETTGIDIKGFQVPASQVESANSLFEKYPGFASNVFLKNPHLRETYLNFVLSLTEIVCKSPKELSNGELAEAYSTLRVVTKAGFKIDWLEEKLKEIGMTRLQGIKEELKDLKLKCEDMDALLEFLR